MQVLDLGHNALSGRLTITGLPSLRALMLNGNQLTGIEGAAHTLVHTELQPAHSSRLHGMISHSCIINAAQLSPKLRLRPRPYNLVIAHDLQAAKRYTLYFDQFLTGS